MELTHRIEEYINSQNRKIWDEIKSHYDFKLVLDPAQRSWASKTEGNVAMIITPNLNVDYVAFTHELLHIYLDYLGLSDYPDFIYSIIGENSFGILVVESGLIADLYNFCSHKKMFPFFKEMGFSEYRFVEQRISFDDNDLKFIKNGFLSNGRQALYIDQFIGHSLSLMNNVVEEDNAKCQKYLAQFRLINPELFDIINDFDKEWENSQHLNLLEIFLKFEERLDKWLIQQNLTFENDYCR